MDQPEPPGRDLPRARSRPVEPAVGPPGGQGLRRRRHAGPGRESRHHVRVLVARAHEKTDTTYRRLEGAREGSAAVDVAFRIYERDRDVGGGLMAGALAFRLFLWLLPAALLAVAALGFGSAQGYGTPSDAVRAMGISSIATDSINRAAQEAQATRWQAAVIGAVFLYSASVALLKGLVVAHAHIWHTPAPRLRSRIRAVAELLVVLVLAAAGTSLAAVIRNWSAAPGLIAMLTVVVVYGAAWWAMSCRLPHGDAPAVRLLPGAALFGLGLQAMHLLLVYYLARRITHASQWYGSLGAAATLLFGLYLGARLTVAAALLNATLWEYRPPLRG